ncbi:hypothetical protein ACO02O_07095 [Dirofilaria immitis]
MKGQRLRLVHQMLFLQHKRWKIARSDMWDVMNEMGCFKLFVVALEVCDSLAFFMLKRRNQAWPSMFTASINYYAVSHATR